MSRGGMVAVPRAGCGGANRHGSSSADHHYSRYQLLYVVSHVFDGTSCDLRLGHILQARVVAGVALHNLHTCGIERAASIELQAQTDVGHLDERNHIPLQAVALLQTSAHRTALVVLVKCAFDGMRLPQAGYLSTYRRGRWGTKQRTRSSSRSPSAPPRRSTAPLCRQQFDNMGACECTRCASSASLTCVLATRYQASAAGAEASGMCWTMARSWAAELVFRVRAVQVALPLSLSSSAAPHLNKVPEPSGMPLPK
jgi:hypothetical protein